MPWQRLINSFVGLQPEALNPDLPLTLVTLSTMDHAAHDEVAFYSDAEYAALIEWAQMGRFILALATRERDELTLLCVDTPEEMRVQIKGLPLVAAGLAQFDIRTVMPLRLTNPIRIRFQ